MTTKTDANKPATCSRSHAPAGSRWESPLDDEFHDLGNGWAVILTGDGWELESQHSGLTIGLDATDEETAIKESKAVAEIVAAENTSSNVELSHGVSEERANGIVTSDLI